VLRQMRSDENLEKSQQTHQHAYKKEETLSLEMGKMPMHAGIQDKIHGESACTRYFNTGL